MIDGGPRPPSATAVTASASAEAFAHRCDAMGARWRLLPRAGGGEVAVARLVATHWTADNATRWLDLAARLDRGRARARRAYVVMAGGLVAFMSILAILSGDPVLLLGAAFFVPLTAVAKSASRWYRARSRRLVSSDGDALRRAMKAVRSDLISLLDDAETTTRELDRQGDQPGVISVWYRLKTFIEDELGIGMTDLRRDRMTRAERQMFCEREAVRLCAKTLNTIEPLIEPAGPGPR